MAFSSSFTRPTDTTAYNSGDLVANSTTAGSVTPLSWRVGPVRDDLAIRRVRIKKTDTGVANASFRVHFYEDSPTVANGDNGAWSSTQSNYMGSADITVDKAFSNGAEGIGINQTATGTEIIISVLNGTIDNKTIYGLVEARGAYTPANAEIFTVIIELANV